jgi:hypothetical protein
MQNKTKEVLLTVLTAHYNSLQTEYQFICHQIGLPPEHRKIQSDEEDLHKLSYSLSVEIQDAEDALQDLSETKTS